MILSVRAKICDDRETRFLAALGMTQQRGRIHLSYLFVLLLVATVVIASFNPERTLRPIADLLVVDSSPRPSNAIVVLLGSDSPERVLKTYELYKQRIAPKIGIAMGYDPTSRIQGAPAGFTWLLPYIRYHIALKSLGIPAGDFELIPSPGAFNTERELTAVAARARELGWGSVTLVTSASHSRRVQWIWSRVAPDIEAVTVPAPEPGYDQWWRYGRVSRNVAYEYIGLLKEIVLHIAWRLGIRDSTPATNDSSSQTFAALYPLPCLA